MRLADRIPNDYGAYLKQIAREAAGRPASSGPGNGATADQEG